MSRLELAKGEVWVEGVQGRNVGNERLEELEDLGGQSGDRMATAPIGIGGCGGGELGAKIEPQPGVWVGVIGAAPRPTAMGSMPIQSLFVSKQVSLRERRG